MNTKELTTKLSEINQSNPDSLLYEITTAILESNENPSELLLQLHGDLGLKYSLNKEFFLTYFHEISDIIDNNLPEAKKHISIENYTIDASWFVYQFVLELLLVNLEIISENQCLFQT